MLLKNYGSLEKKEGEIIGIASTSNPDRDGEVIKQDGWDLKNFKKNPVILAGHNYREFPIGKATEIKVEENKLIFKMIFSEATQLAKEAYQLVQEGILKTFSVGFIPREYNETNQNEITKAELLEISLVSVPANPQAIVTAKSFDKNNLAVSLVKEWLLEENNIKGIKELEEKKEEITEVLKEGEFECDCGKKYLFKYASEGGNTEENQEEGGEVEIKELDIKLLQKTTGYLQELLCKVRKGGAK